MNILVLNCGSSSVKSSLYDFDKSSKPLWQAHLQWEGQFENLQLTVQGKSSPIAQGSFKQILRELFSHLSYEIKAVGHRIVQGAHLSQSGMLLTQEVKEKLRSLEPLAPLHNRLELEGIEVLEELFPKAFQVAVFDTAFHRTLPEKARFYPGPYAWMSQGIERYGFHGISYQYCLHAAADLIGAEWLQKRVVICHLGSGASLCALFEGKSVDTTMGFTPLEGLMMDTRSGSIDPGILLYLLKEKNHSVDDLKSVLYEQSGLLGLSEVSSDMREVRKAAEQNNKRAQLALDVYMHRLNQCIGSMVATLKGLDVLIFTAGIGENAPWVREQVCENFAFLGAQIDPDKNTAQSSQDSDLSTSSSNVKVLYIHTQENEEIARTCLKIIG